MKINIFQCGRVSLLYARTVSKVEDPRNGTPSSLDHALVCVRYILPRTIEISQCGRVCYFPTTASILRESTLFQKTRKRDSFPFRLCVGVCVVLPVTIKIPQCGRAFCLKNFCLPFFRDTRTNGTPSHLDRALVCVRYILPVTIKISQCS